MAVKLEFKGTFRDIPAEFFSEVLSIAYQFLGVERMAQDARHPGHRSHILQFQCSIRLRFPVDMDGHELRDTSPCSDTTNPVLTSTWS
jgi:hypothetical protein